MATHGGKSDYILLNKDLPMLAFHCRRNEFDEPEFFEDQWLTALRPIGYRGLPSFLDQRKAPKHRKHIQQLLEQYGCDDPEGFLRVTHALSLNDTFWVREADSSLTWREVSLYTNPFSEIISEAAFDGIISETDLSSTSPEFGTDGYYAKCWKREDNGIFLYKSGSAHYEIEPLSEYLLRSCPASCVLGQSLMTWTTIGRSWSANARSLPTRLWGWQRPARSFVERSVPYQNCCPISRALAAETLSGGCVYWTR